MDPETADPDVLEPCGGLGGRDGERVERAAIGGPI